MLNRIYFLQVINTNLRMKKKIIIFSELLARMISTCYYFKNNLNKRGKKKFDLPRCCYIFKEKFKCIDTKLSDYK